MYILSGYITIGINKNGLTDDLMETINPVSPFIIGFSNFCYLAKLTARVSRMTVIFTCPGYVISS